MSQNNTHIPQKAIDAVNALNIVDVVSDYVTLKKRGVNHVGICPFHTDSSPSFYVSANKQICKCFACGQGGSIIAFVQKIENVSYPQAIRILAKKNNIEIPEIQLTPEEIASNKRRESIFIAVSASQDLFVANLEQSPDTLHYLKMKRQLSDDSIKRYQIGYAAVENQLSKMLPSKGYKIDTLMLAGVVSQNDKGYHYDRFRNRIMFPFVDLSGKIVGFTGRDLSGTADAKYMNSPETDIYHKSQLVYGLWQARERIGEADEVFLVEGQLDVISFAQNGLENTVAGSGTSLSDDQIKQIKRFTNNVTLVYDGDKAGFKAALRQIKALLAFGVRVKSFPIPEGLDPDDLARKLGSSKLSEKIALGKKSFDTYIFEMLGTASKTKEDRIEDLDIILDCISVIPDKVIQNEYIKSVCLLFEMDHKEIKNRINPPKEFKVQSWDPGFYGVDEADLLLKENTNQECLLTFDKAYFLNQFSITPVVYIHGKPTVSDIQILLARISKFSINKDKHILIDDEQSSTTSEPRGLLVLKWMFYKGCEIVVTNDESDLDPYGHSFCDYYIQQYSSKLITVSNGAVKSQLISLCVEVISYLDADVRTVLLDQYAKYLGIKKGELTQLLKPLLAAKKDQSVLAMQRIAEYSDAILPDGTNNIPDYVTQDEEMLAEYTRSGFFPLCNKAGESVAYMFRNPTGGGHSCISDFYMKPLIHIYDKEAKQNKRVVELCHLHKGRSTYIEWQSDIFANLSKVNEKLICEGAFNFEGTLQQWKKIWRSMSYKFTHCHEIRIFGQQPDGFFAWGNAIHHKVKNDNGEEEFRIDYVNDIGVVNHGDKNYYSPAFSKIYLSDRNSSDDIYKQIRYLRYKEVSDKDKLSFGEWAKLMDEVYQINNNGKWAILYAITCAFRDYIFANRKYFTALFFIGPTSSGKSQIACSIRNLFADADTPLFNLNTGSFASLFMQMESFRNVPLILDEYNDGQIDPNIFQALKAATLDGVGRMKVANTEAKIISSSEVNTSLILLGQESPQDDGGSLANRVILRDVPYTPRGEFTEQQTAIYLKLKKHERIGLCNILCDILSLRPIFEKYYLNLLDEEIKILKERAKINVTNTEGFTRILNAVSLMSATCRLVEEYTDLKLPFSHEDFRKIAVDAILEQLERIALSDKLTEFFNAINSLLTHGKFIPGREFKIEMRSEVTRRTKGKETESVKIEADTNVIYLDVNLIYKYYEQFVGREKAISQQTIESYFNSNDAYIGFCRGVRYSWNQVVEDYRHAPIPNTEDPSLIDRASQRKIEKKNRIGTGHIFNYDKLKAIMDIDLERIDDELLSQEEPPIAETEQKELPF